MASIGGGIDQVLRQPPGNGLNAQNVIQMRNLSKPVMMMLMVVVVERFNQLYKKNSNLAL